MAIMCHDIVLLTTDSCVDSFVSLFLCSYQHQSLVEWSVNNVVTIIHMHSIRYSIILLHLLLREWEIEFVVVNNHQQNTTDRNSHRKIFHATIIASINISQEQVGTDMNHFMKRVSRTTPDERCSRLPVKFKMSR